MQRRRYLEHFAGCVGASDLACIARDAAAADQILNDTRRHVEELREKLTLKLTWRSMTGIGGIDVATWQAWKNTHV